ncbi:MAG: PKD domain-containing protein [Candidatus Delongbacteria bacterium]|nr:PKD domain-containing protein [Candidatus Delongbacteria bacterium]
MKNIIFILFVITALISSCSDYEGNPTTPTDPITPTACFTFTDAFILTDSSGHTTYIPAEFTNCSENAETYYWDFGDSTYSTEFEPSHFYTKDGYFIVKLEAYNEFRSDFLVDTLFVLWAAADKPNIYIYPSEDIDLSVELNFPQEGFVTKSIPQITNNIWNISVTPDGLINNEYEFLFYESMQPDVWQLENGWCISKDSLETFFTENMNEHNFNTREINDFIEYWIPLLKEKKYYKIYPQYNTEIDEVIQINFSLEPNNVNRLFYRILGSDEFVNIPEEDITPFNRDGFTVVEWGVVIR